MKILSIDSSSKVATVAILDENNLLAEYVVNDKREHSVVLMDMIEKILMDTNLSINDIDGFVVSKGPGSFTGLRIGMATVKGLSTGGNKPYVSVSSLDSLAFSLSSFKGVICSMMDALRENVYTCLYKSENGHLERLIEHTSLDLDELVEKLKEQNEDIIFVGDGATKHKDFLKENFKNPLFAPISLNIVRASTLGELGMKLLQDGVYDDPNSAPIYLKKPQAQREYEKRLGVLSGNNS